VGLELSDEKNERIDLRKGKHTTGILQLSSSSSIQRLVNSEVNRCINVDNFLIILESEIQYPHNIKDPPTLSTHRCWTGGRMTPCW